MKLLQLGVGGNLSSSSSVVGRHIISNRYDVMEECAYA